MPAQQLTFVSWVRDRVSGLATGQAGGRAAAQTAVTLTARRPDGSPAGAETRNIPFQIAGPADIQGLSPDAVVRRYPAPDTPDHESDRCPYVELADPVLPWRYTPTGTPGPTSGALHPWLVLVVGIDGPELSLTDGMVTIQPAAQGAEQALGVPNTAYRYAHVQVDPSGHRVARILSGRPLEAGRDYLAALVPAYDVNGNRSWTGTAPVTVPAYDAWRFHTATPPGSFEDLAGRLRPGDAPASTGRTALAYPRLGDEPVPGLTVRGALVAMSADGPTADGPLPEAIRTDLTNLVGVPPRDPEGRPIVSLPRYGEAWHLTAPTGSTWGRDLNRDPRHRGVAGLGLDNGIRKQEELVSDVLDHLGDLQQARERVRNAAVGVAVSRSLWQRRVPTGASERLLMLGPAFARLALPDGTVDDLATAATRTPARGSFSAAARRVLRAGPARTTLPTEPPTPVTVLTRVNSQPPALVPRTAGLPLDPGPLGVFEQQRHATVSLGVLPIERLGNALHRFEGTFHAALAEQATRLMQTAFREFQLHEVVPWGPVFALLAAADAMALGHSTRESALVQHISTEIGLLQAQFRARADDAPIITLLAAQAAAVPNEPTLQPVNVASLFAGVSTAFDPTVGTPPVVERVLSSTTGLDGTRPLAPPEICVGLERPVWRDLPDEWLLPGVGLLPTDSVVALETNPVFVDAYLAGLNSQLLAELRWRNIPVATGCTPIRRFWDRADRSNGDRVDDIAGLHAWTETSVLGDSSHRGAGASSQDLVVAVRGDLFRRYPKTLVYLLSAEHAPGRPDFERNPLGNAERMLPSFQGQIGTDVTFFGFPGMGFDDAERFWVVFEEPPAGYRFRNDTTATATTGHAWAGEMLVEPLRVLIPGFKLITAGA